MNALKLLGRLLSAVPAALDALDAIGKRISRRPPPAPTPSDATQPRIKLPVTSPVYKDEHCWSTDTPSEPPVYCYWCKQLKARASRYCPGYPPKGLE